MKVKQASTSYASLKQGVTTLKSVKQASTSYTALKQGATTLQPIKQASTTYQPLSARTLGCSEPTEAPITCGLQSAVSTDNGATWTLSTIAQKSSTLYSGLAVSGNTQYVTYNSQNSNGSEYILWFAKNSGNSWVRTQLVNTTGFETISYCRIGVVGSTVIITYLQGNTDVKMAKSTDGGTTWVISIVDQEASYNSYIDLCVVDANTYLLCYQHDSADSRLRLAKTTNGGSNWTLSWVSLNNDTESWNVIKSLDATTIFVIFPTYNPKRIKCAKSINGGTTWSLVTIDSVSYQGKSYKELDLYILDANTLFVVYLDDATNDMRFAKSTDAGATWTDTLVSDTVADNVSAGITAQDANTIYIAHYENTVGTITLSKSIDGGTTWVDTVIDPKVGDLYTSDVEINTDGDIFCVYFVSCAGEVW